MSYYNFAKVKIITRINIVIVLLFTLSSCLNHYESEAIGKYELYEYNLINSKIQVDNFSTLLLKKDKSFELKYYDKTINGKWKANDYGDWTSIELNVNGKVTEGKIGNNSILFESGNMFGLTNFENMLYVRIENEKAQQQ